ncbi:MAG TPA: DUF1501 domain-containing protein [Planctomycetaceae bacterium]|nr:DUF1501 domain-containing protein [Planctomycetaceae bacterium]HCK51837.1 DUF1501 domain-containing protein [Planctomycetaceae bacterium]|tara:strand:- start:1293 stop:2594 length:1302 start_codon:yes stop_codon:yes gene_type:complete
MLTLKTDRKYRDCDGATRRDFIRVGGLGALSLAGLMQARSAKAATTGQSTKQTSVVWLWLGGGPTHVETFDPKMTAPVEYRSVTGEVKTRIPGVTLGGNFPGMAQVADKMAFVRSFHHGNSGHGGGTHWVMTGYNNRGIDNGGLPSRPSIGSIAAKHRGPNHPETGMPTYIRLGGIGSDGPAFLGTSYAPFGTSGEARKNMSLQTQVGRLEDRRGLLTGLDRLRRTADRQGVVEGLNAFEQQAFNLVLGKAPQAFDLKKEDPRTVAKYGGGLGSSMLMARRLCEAGCGFVTLSYGGWDMHGNIQKSMNGRGPVVDRAVSAFVDDVSQRGLSDRILLVVTGEFGRTPKINRNKGRDHWAPLSTLALAGGGLQMGQTVGESDAKLYRPKSDPVTPQDLMATVFHVLGMDHRLQFTNQGGRPVYMIEEGDPIKSLI